MNERKRKGYGKDKEKLFKGWREGQIKSRDKEDALCGIWIGVYGRYEFVGFRFRRSLPPSQDVGDRVCSAKKKIYI